MSERERRINALKQLTTNLKNATESLILASLDIDEFEELKSTASELKLTIGDLTVSARMIEQFLTTY